jgi:hypothetical protein
MPNTTRMLVIIYLGFSRMYWAYVECVISGMFVDMVVLGIYAQPTHYWNLKELNLGLV